MGRPQPGPAARHGHPERHAGQLQRRRPPGRSADARSPPAWRWRPTAPTSSMSAAKAPARARQRCRPEPSRQRVVPVIRALAAAGSASRSIRAMPPRCGPRSPPAPDRQRRLRAGARSAVGRAWSRSSGCPVVLMHMRGTPATMNAQARLPGRRGRGAGRTAARIEAAMQAGIRPEQIAIDPGHRLRQARGAFAGRAARTAGPGRALAFRLLVGVSRKAFIGACPAKPRADRRLGGSLAAGLFAVLRGASILRVHDVRETVQAFVSGRHCSNEARFRFPNTASGSV